MTAIPAPVFIIGEAMIELSGLDGKTAQVGVAGDTFNTAVYLARAGVPVSYLTALGEDPFSERIREALQDEGIDTSHVLTAPGRNAGLYAISLDDEGERTFTYWRNDSAARAFFSAPGAEAALEAMAKAPAVYLSGISLSLYGPDDRARLFDVLKTVRDNGGEVIFDLNYRPRGWPDSQTAHAVLDKASQLATICLPTFEDVEALYGTKDPETASVKYQDLGAREVTVKDGGNGAFLSSGGWVKPAEKIRPVDTTGAGDSFNAGYLTARIKGLPPEEAALAGHRLAGAVICEKGAILPKGHTAWPETA
ncbi:sugar kinase [Parvularcula marina]|uniref:sugar kinase n=1 Tax=Parvularcula marina TaxID=2292771 RepID=UPI003513C454